ncbi:hypothetical protein EV131_102270 [Rhizobium laguerreae]|uniref:Uncharacterized protein n=1 Tax=Rhizobium laguerreae TaxID=1076926 RepID=A0AAX2QTD9_9HYPH|nr:hypothetical protein EV131_102270 [Rhizobium laguerreae]
MRPSPWARENDFLLRVIHGADAPWLDSCDKHRNDGDWGGVSPNFLLTSHGGAIGLPAPLCSTRHLRLYTLTDTTQFTPSPR